MISGKQIAEIRKANGWTLKQLADKIGIHHLLLARIEKGSVTKIKPEHEAALTTLLENPEQDILIKAVDPHPLHLSPQFLVGPQPDPFPTVTTSSVTSEDLLVKDFLTTNEHLVPSHPPHSLDNCADALASWICSLDPTWANRLQIMRDERGFSTTQALSTCIAYVLEHDLHMVILKHDALEPSPWRRGEKMECPECHELYVPDYPGKPFDKNECADAYRKREAEQVVVT